MTIKKGVNIASLHPALWYALGKADTIRGWIDGNPVTITSANDGEHKPGSLHYLNRAVDLRTHDLTPKETWQFFIALRERLVPEGFDVVLEPYPQQDTPRDRNEHLHIEYDPKATRALLGMRT